MLVGLVIVLITFVILTIKTRNKNHQRNRNQVHDSHPEKIHESNDGKASNTSLITKMTTTNQNRLDSFSLESIDIVSLTASGGITGASLTTGALIGENAYFTGAITTGSLHSNSISTSIPNGLPVMSTNGIISPVFPNVVDFPLATSSWKRIYGVMAATNNLYTVPLGYYAVYMGASTSGSSNNNVYASPDNGVTLYLVTLSASTAAGTNLNANSYIFLPGDSIILTCTGTPTLTMSILTYPVAGAILKPIVFRNLPSGTTTIYTCPASTRSSTSSSWAGFNTDASSFHISSLGGTSSSVTVNAVITSTPYVITIFYICLTYPKTIVIYDTRHKLFVMS